MTRRTHPLFGYRIKIKRARSSAEMARGEWGDHWEARVMHGSTECAMNLNCASWQEAMDYAWNRLMVNEIAHQRRQQQSDRQRRIERRPGFWRTLFG